MNEPTILSLRNRLSHLRDAALTFFDEAEKIYEASEDTETFSRRYNQKTVWDILPERNREYADEVRAELRRLLVQVSSVVKDSVLIDETDLRTLSRQIKTMLSALRFREFQQFGVNIHHDEGVILGIDPPSQHERELHSVSEARNIFTEAYRAVTETTDYWSPQLQSVSSLYGVKKDENVRRPPIFSST